MVPLVAVPGGWELVLVVLVILLLFGAKKLPELARGTGRALRIFRSETKGLIDDAVDEDDQTPQQKEIAVRRTTTGPAARESLVREPRDGATS